MIPVVKGNARLKLALNISSGAPITVVKKKIHTPQLVKNKTTKI